MGTVADQRVDVGDSVMIGVAARFTDPEGDPLTFAAASSDTSVARAEARGDSVLLAAVAKGEATVSVTARDPGGETAGQSFTVTVPNRAPTATDPISPDSVLLGDTLAVHLGAHFEDPDGDALGFSGASSDSGVAVVRVSGSTLLVVPVAPGRTIVTVTARDPDRLSAEQSFEVTAAHPNRAPAAVGEIRDRTVYLGRSDSVDVSPFFSDPDGDSLTYTVATSRSIRVTAVVNGSTVALTAASVGSSTITVTAWDPDGLSARQRFRTVVEPVPAPDLVVDAPTVDRDSVEVDGEFTLSAVVRNQGNADAQSLNTLRVYESFDAVITTGDREIGADSVMPLEAGEATGVSLRVTGPPWVGTRFYGACVAAAPTESNTRNNCSAAVPVRFWQPNRAPQPRDSIRARTLEVGKTFSIGVPRFFTDADRDPLRYAAESSDDAVATASISREVLTVAAVAPGTATITVTARDVTTRPPGSLAATQKFDVTVRPVPRPDLVIEMALDSFNIGPEQPLALAAVVRNQGTLDVPSGTRVRFFLSSDTTISTADAEVGSTTIGPVAQSGQFDVSISLRSPTDERAYHYGACVDSVAAESRTRNNCSRALTVVVEEERPPNRPPSVEKTFRDVTDALPDRRFRAPLAGIFGDPDGDPLTITATSSNEAVARAEVARDSIIVYTLAPGTATVTVTATDPGGLSAGTEFDVTVLAPCEGFCMQFLVQSTMPEEQRAPIRAAVGAWEDILAPTELPDVVVPDGFNCAGVTLSRREVDDHMFIAAVGSIDGPRGVLARAGFCAQRSGGGFPAVSIAVFDEADIEWLVATESLGDVAIHEIAHGLGFIGGRMNSLGLLGSDPETHFTGSAARAAFDAAGGAGYTGAKVPMEPDRSHWRESVLDVELMTPRIEVGVQQPISAITLGAMADLGYSVDFELASPYRLPDSRAPLAERGPRQVIDLSDDVLRGPVTILGPDGQVLDTIPAPAGYDSPLRSRTRLTLDLRSRGPVGRPPESPGPLDPAARDASRQVTWIVDLYPPGGGRLEAPTRRPR